MFILLLSLACGEKEDTASETETSSEIDTSDTDTDDTDSGNDTSDTDDSGVTDGDCATLSVEICHTRDDCTARSANPMTFDEPNQCWELEPSQEVSCLSNDMGCGDAITYASPPDSEACWWFSDTCIPEGWTECSYPDEPECG